MLSFREYLSALNEKFLRGAEANDWGDKSYSDLYVDPTPDEMASGGQVRSWSVPQVYMDYGSPCYYLGGWLTSRHLIVWDRNILQHADAKRSLPELSGGSGAPLPLYIYYFAQKRVCALEVSDFSKTYKHQTHRNLKWLKLAATHPAFRAFGVITRNENDGSILVLK
tara:strand:- start:3081 stop:3581 length:501 start_codon:yes stop_codon:yes gene_type:complete